MGAVYSTGSPLLKKAKKLIRNSYEKKYARFFNIISLSPYQNLSQIPSK
jgi:hypothetical protein